MSRLEMTIIYICGWRSAHHHSASSASPAQSAPELSKLLAGPTRGPQARSGQASSPKTAKATRSSSREFELPENEVMVREGELSCKEMGQLSKRRCNHILDALVVNCN